MIDQLIRRLNGGILAVISTHDRLEANLIRADGVPGPDVYMLKDAGANFALLTLENRAYFKILDTTPALTLYSQRDPRWRDEIYAGGLTFGAAGCYVTCVAMMASLAGYDDEPPEVARKLREAGIFSGALLARPDKIPGIYPRLCYDGTLRWHKVPADMEQLERELEKGPTIIEVDFKPPTSKFDQHFVIAEQLTSGDEDLVIVDPWDGTRTQLLQRYAQDHWNLGRALYGMRLLGLTG